MPEKVSERARVWRVRADAVAGVQVTENFAALVGDRRHFVLADDKGVYLKGPLSIIADARNIRRGGLWIGIDDFLHMIPSTIMTPIPAQIPFPPVFISSQIAKDVAFFSAFLV